MTRPTKASYPGPIKGIINACAFGFGIAVYAAMIVVALWRVA